MTKKDIQFTITDCLKELRSWIGPLGQISVALELEFIRLVSETEAKVAARGYGNWDTYGATLFRGKVNGLTLAAHALAKERAS